MDITKLSPGMLILFKNSKGSQCIGKIAQINDDKILMHDMITTSDFMPLKGRWGGLNITIDQIIKIII